MSWIGYSLGKAQYSLGMRIYWNSPNLNGTRDLLGSKKVPSTSSYSPALLSEWGGKPILSIQYQGGWQNHGGGKNKQSQDPGVHQVGWEDTKALTITSKVIDKQALGTQLNF